MKYTVNVLLNIMKYKERQWLSLTEINKGKEDDKNNYQ